MKSSLIVTFLAAALTASLSFSVLACEGERGEGHKGKRHHKGERQMQFRQAVVDHMIQAGDISQAEVDEMKRQRKADRETLKTLRESGDEAAYKAHKQAMKEAHKAKRAEVKAYIESNDALKETLAAMKEEHRANRKARHGEK